MKKIFFVLSLLFLSSNLLPASTIWYLNSAGDNYYPKPIAEVVLPQILGTKANNFLSGQTISITPEQRTQLTLPSHVTQITNYNPLTKQKTTTLQTPPPSAATQPAPTAAPRMRTATTSRGTTSSRAKTSSSSRSRSTSTRSRGRSTSRGRARTPAPSTTTTPAASTPAPAPAPRISPTTATPPASNEKILELENKVNKLTNIVNQLQQQIGA